VGVVALGAIGVGLSVAPLGVERRGDLNAREPAPDRSWSAAPLPGPLAPVRHEPGVAALRAPLGRQGLRSTPELPGEAPLPTHAGPTPTLVVVTRVRGAGAATMATTAMRGPW